MVKPEDYKKKNINAKLKNNPIRYRIMKKKLVKTTTNKTATINIGKYS